MENLVRFEDMYESFFSQLTLETFIEFDKNLGSDKLLSDMFKYLWELNDVQKHMKINLIHECKDNNRAEFYREEGNSYYKNKDLSKALEQYNKSIIYSPYPQEVNLLTSDKNSLNLSLGYANRSAVLYELQNYEACLKDINSALYFGYPSVLKSKLIERKAKCYIAQNDNLKAKEILNEYIDEVKSLGDIKASVLEESVIKIESMLSRCDLEEVTLQKSKDSLCFQLHKKMCAIEFPIIPQISEKNATIPSLSNAVTLNYSVDKGRHLIANRDISPGEVVLNERCFIAVVFPSKLFSHCSFCLNRTFTPVPCQGCSTVVFCCEECAVSARQQYHEMECNLLPTLISLDIGKNSFLIFRLILKITLEELKTRIPLFDKEKVEKSDLDFAFNEENIYASDDFRTIYHLVTNKERSSVNVLLKRGLTAVCLVKLLMESKFFPDNNKCVEEIEDIILVGKTIFKLLLSFPCNVHSITEECINVTNHHESHLEEIGAGAFGALSLTNHSCNPTISRSFCGSIAIARAIQYIPKGAEITDSYGYHYAMDNIEKRQTELKERYYFNCICEACLGNWDPLDDQICFKCPKCNSKMEIPIDVCSECKVDISKPFYDGLSSNQIFTNLQQTIESMQKLFKKIAKEHSCELYEKDILDAVSVICLYASLPNKTLVESQDRLKYCFDRRGSHYYGYFTKKQINYIN